MPSYKLTYFPGRGIAEPIRFLLSYLGKDFEDFQLKREDWPSVKPSMPFGKLPVLEIDRKKIHQSIAVTRFLGKEAKLAGKDDWEALQIDIAVDTINDLRLALAIYRHETDEEVKAKKKDIAINETAPFYLAKLDEMVRQNGGYLANGVLSWADLYFIAISDFLLATCCSDFFEKYPNLKELKKKVLAIPSIKKWVEKRPYSEI